MDSPQGNKSTYEDGYKAGFEDAKLEHKAHLNELQRKYALALMTLCDIDNRFREFCNKALGKKK